MECIKGIECCSPPTAQTSYPTLIRSIRIYIYIYIYIYGVVRWLWSGPGDVARNAACCEPFREIRNSQVAKCMNNCVLRCLVEFRVGPGL